MKLTVLFSLAVGALGANCANSTNVRAPTASIQILSYNDVYEMKPEDDATQHGVLVGGPSRVVPLAKKLRSSFENSLVIFAGDTMSPSLWSGQFKGLQMIEAHNALGVDFACLGNHEFDFGIDAFLNVSVASKFPWLNANAYEKSTGKLLRETIPNTVKTLSSPTMGTVKIGAFGVMYDMKDSSKGMYWTDPIQAAKEQVKYLREVEKVDMVIALTHQLWEDDNKFSQEVKGVDLIYGGHDHSAMLQSTFGAWYLKSDLNFRSVWVSDVKYYAPLTEGKNKYSAYIKQSHKNLAITQDMPTDPDFEAVIDKYETKIASLFNRPIGNLCAETDLTKKAVRFGEAPIGNFFADAYKSFYGKVDVEVGVMNGGGIRTDKVWSAGPLTLGDVISWSPFGDMMVAVKTTGADFKKFLDFLMKSSCGDKVVAENGYFAHVAGLSYQYTCSGPKAGAVTELKWMSPKRTGDVLDTDVFHFVTSENVKGQFDQSGAKGEFVVSPNEASRVDMLLEEYIASLPDSSVCPKLEGRAKVIPSA
ncbi:calcineurin-like phosphoesterase [Achlya hypogyna]|uniref:Calcineurin-like phosphoesterase n=1 Tax=Achlya hypogyna TaxID=1202772 RepID=A0A0A7CMU0_ACHHY|nr:secreted protein [Achlya hypogyna]OQR87167.1 calcineurin-like phosphoesterase [Achlya hypogyna]